MANGTVQVLGIPTEPTPFDYQVTTPDALDLVAVIADYDGSAAGGSFVPMVELISPAGEVMAQGKGSTVAAGDSRRVTFAPFLEEDTATPSGSFSVTNADYSVTVNSIAHNSGDFLALNALVSGTALLDISTPKHPKVLTAGYYCFTCQFRVVLGLGGAPTAGSGHTGTISVVGGLPDVNGFLTYPSAGFGWIPEWSATTIPQHMTAGQEVSISVFNGDSASSRVYDATGFAVALLA